MLPPGEQKIRVENIRDLLDAKFPPLDCYIESELLLKGSTLLLGGPAKTGKSFIMLEFCRALSTGTPLFDNPDFSVPEPVKVIYIDMEVGRRTNFKRFEKIFEKEDPKVYDKYLKVIHREDALSLQLDSISGCQKLAAVIKEHQPNVMILDPISFMFHGDENSNSEVGKLFYNIAKLKQMGDEHGLSIIFSHHYGKPVRDKEGKVVGDPLDMYNFRGASKWKDGGDSLITVQRRTQLREDPEAWESKMRFLFRHGSSYPEIVCEFNRDLDLRHKVKDVHRKKEVKLPPLKLQRPEPTVDIQGRLQFGEGNTKPPGWMPRNTKSQT